MFEWVKKIFESSNLANSVILVLGTKIDEGFLHKADILEQ